MAGVAAVAGLVVAAGAVGLAVGGVIPRLAACLVAD